MYLTDLSRAVQPSGLTVHEVGGWQTRGRGPMVAVEGVVAHHTGRPGLSGPLCNLGLGRDGAVYVVAAGKANHAGLGSWPGIPRNDANDRMIGIEAESAGTGDWTREQLAAYPLLNNALARHYAFPVRMVIGHLEWAPTRKIDPHGWPGGMAGMRASTAHPPKSGDDMTTKTLIGSTDRPTVLTRGTWRTLAMTATGVSFVAGPGRVMGVLTAYLSTPDHGGVRLEAYLARKVGSEWIYAGGDGQADFAPGEQQLRYPVGVSVPAGWLLRLRALDLSAPDRVPGPDLSVVKSAFNVDVRS
jgi:hypothetical protein